ncbi:MAG: hypothetical protein H6823_26935 [Planctomycetaceae bacterium]|nr:hypothetical protein [Planctomycetaceae bacterium]
MSEVDPEIKALQDSIFLSKVARARRTPIDEKIFDGPRLFDQSCARMRSGIRHEHPDFTSEQVERELRRCLKIKRLLDERGLYVDAGYIDEQL